MVFSLSSPFWVLGAVVRTDGLPLDLPVRAVMAVCPGLAAAGEEVGWTAYVMDTAVARWGLLGAGLVIGIVWGVWHIVPDAQSGRSASWIGWQLVVAVALRVVCATSATPWPSRQAHRQKN